MVPSLRLVRASLWISARRGGRGTGRRAGFRSRWGASPLEVRSLSPASPSPGRARPVERSAHSWCILVVHPGTDPGLRRFCVDLSTSGEVAERARPRPGLTPSAPRDEHACERTGTEAVQPVTDPAFVPIPCRSVHRYRLREAHGRLIEWPPCLRTLRSSREIASV